MQRMLQKKNYSCKETFLVYVEADLTTRNSYSGGSIRKLSKKKFFRFAAC